MAENHQVQKRRGEKDCGPGNHGASHSQEGQLFGIIGVMNTNRHCKSLRGLQGRQPPANQRGPKCDGRRKVGRYTQLIADVLPDMIITNVKTYQSLQKWP